MVRWWNGVSWSDVATPAGPGVKVETPPWSAPQARPAAEPWSPVPPESPPPNHRAAWITVAGALVLIAAVVIGLLVTRDDAPAGPVDERPAR